VGADAAYADAFEAWRRLRAAEGECATLIDLYALAAHRRGLAAHELSIEERDQLTARALRVMFPGFEVAPSSNRAQRDPVEIVRYDRDWPRRYEAWERRLADALGSVAKRIEHVGSTAITGLAAKPVIDIQVSVEDPEAEAGYVPAIEALGVQLRSCDDEHRYFRPYSGLPREVQVHVCRVGSTWEREHLLFRDYLRAAPPARDAYTQAKLLAADRWHDDRIAYADAKGTQIRVLMVAAEEWAENTGWRIQKASESS
jgi:GrpB-like predicted nucleotidyltransferase (UPF0157 family)